MDAIVTFFEQVESTMLLVAGSAAVIGFLGVGMMYALSAIPVVSQWKQDNPRAFGTTITGLLILAFAGTGGVGVILGF
jgi:hypothetical protein